MIIWKLLAGVVVFLMGSSFMEEALRHAAGRRFKLFLKRQTNNPFKAIFGGAFLTLFMQSSSVVNLLVLSLVGAGVVQMHQALAVMMGANLGTTVTGWLMAALGFSFDIRDFALPIIAVAGMMVLVNDKGKMIHHIAKFFLGFAFLFLGLSYIREAVEFLVMSTPLTDFKEYPLIFFSMLGFVLTALVQSSSVTMALVLSVLYHKGIDVYAAAAIVLGAEIGTTLKLGLASLGGLAAKKRVALGNITFNMISSVSVFFFIHPIMDALQRLPGMADPLWQIACFQSFVNIAGILLFLPFLKSFGRFLEKRFRNESSMEYLNKISFSNIPLALEAVEKENRHLFAHVMYYMKTLFELTTSQEEIQSHPYEKKFLQGVKYEQVKILYGEVHAYCIRMKQQEMNHDESIRLESLLTSMRNLMYAAKNLRDIEKDIHQLSRSSNEIKYQFYLHTQDQIKSFYMDVVRILNTTIHEENFTHIKRMHLHLQKAYDEGIIALYEDSQADAVNAVELATLVNVHREMMTAFKSVLFSLKETFLSAQDATYFEEAPGFIH